MRRNASSTSQTQPLSLSSLSPSRSFLAFDENQSSNQSGGRYSAGAGRSIFDLQSPSGEEIKSSNGSEIQMKLNISFADVSPMISFFSCFEQQITFFLLPLKGPERSLIRPTIEILPNNSSLRNLLTFQPYIPRLFKPHQPRVG